MLICQHYVVGDYAIVESLLSQKLMIDNIVFVLKRVDKENVLVGRQDTVIDDQLIPKCRFITTVPSLETYQQACEDSKEYTKWYSQLTQSELAYEHSKFRAKYCCFDKAVAAFSHANWLY